MNNFVVSKISDQKNISVKDVFHIDEKLPELSIDGHKIKCFVTIQRILLRGFKNKNTDSSDMGTKKIKYRISLKGIFKRLCKAKLIIILYSFSIKFFGTRAYLPF